MSTHGAVTLVWGDCEHTFNISKIGQALELQDKCGGVGIGTIDLRLRTGQFFVNDFREVIRLGLIGGGISPPEALMLVKRYVDDRPWKESVLVATAIVMAAMVGIPSEVVGKKKSRARAAKMTTVGSPAPTPTGSAQP